MRDSLSPSPSLSAISSSSSPLWLPLKIFFFSLPFPFPSSASLYHLLSHTLVTAHEACGRRKKTVFRFLLFLTYWFCTGVCVRLSVCVFQYLHFSLAPAGETTVSPSFRESWPQQRKAMHRRKRLNSKIRYGWAFLSPPRILITPLTCAAPPLCLANTGFICMTRCSDFFHRLEWCAEGRNVYNLVLWARLKQLDRESFVEVKG